MFGWITVSWGIPLFVQLLQEISSGEGKIGPKRNIPKSEVLIVVEKFII